MTIHCNLAVNKVNVRVIIISLYIFLKTETVTSSNFPLIVELQNLQKVESKLIYFSLYFRYFTFVIEMILILPKVAFFILFPSLNKQNNHKLTI